MTKPTTMTMIGGPLDGQYRRFPGVTKYGQPDDGPKPGEDIQYVRRLIVATDGDGREFWVPVLVWSELDALRPAEVAEEDA